MPNYWIMKSEPDTYSIERLKKEGHTLWNGVRNYQVRNMMALMKKGDQAYFYHSSCALPGIVGLMEITGRAITDDLAFDPKSEYFDEKAKKRGTNPWLAVPVSFKAQFKNPITLKELKSEAHPALKNLIILKTGNRLSITPITKEEASYITTLVP